MVQGLVDCLKDEFDDLDGWFQLGCVYFVFGNVEGVKDVYKNVVVLLVDLLQIDLRKVIVV